MHGSLVSNQSLVSKVFFPRILVPISTVASVFLDFLVGLGVGIIMLFVYGINPGWPVLLIPVWAILIAMIGTGLGMMLSAMLVKYRDVGYVMPWALQILLYGSPVAYAVSSIPGRLRWIFEANPVTWFLEGFRWSMLGTDAPELWQVAGLVVISFGVLFAGILYFQSHEREFADVI